MTLWKKWKDLVKITNRPVFVDPGSLLKIGAPDDVFSFGSPRPWKKSFDWRKLHGALVIPARCLHQRSFLQYIARRGMGRHGKVLNKVVVVVANKNGIKHGTKQDGTGKPCFCLPNLGSKLPHTKRIWQTIRSCWEKIGPQIVLFFWWKVPFQERFQCLSDPGLLGG